MQSSCVNLTSDLRAPCVCMCVRVYYRRGIVASVHYRWRLRVQSSGRCARRKVKRGTMMRRGTARDDNGKSRYCAALSIGFLVRGVCSTVPILMRQHPPPPLFLARIAPSAVVKKLYRISGRRWIACLRVSRSTCTCTRSCRAFLKATRRFFSTERGSGDVRMTRHESRVLRSKSVFFFVRKRVRNK